MENTDNNKIISDDIFENDDIESIEIVENDMHEDSGYQLSAGTALNENELYELSSRQNTSIIYVLGPVRSGKTTFETMLYECFVHKIDDELWFSGSLTLPGYEKRLHSLRVKSGTSHVEMPRTSKDEKRVYLHLELLDKTTNEKRSMVFADISGESFEECKANKKNLEKQLPFLDMAKKIMLFMDGEALVDLKMRNNAVSNVKTFLKTLKSSKYYYKGMNIGIIISKNDYIYSKRNDNVVVFIDTLADRFEEFNNEFNLDIFRIEAKNGAELKDESTSINLINLLKNILRYSSSTQKIGEYDKGKLTNEFNKYYERMFE